MVTQRDTQRRAQPQGQKEQELRMRPASRQLIGVPDPRPQPPVDFIPREFLSALRAATRAEPQAVAPQAAESQAAPQAEPQAAAQQDAGVTPSATSARYDPNNPYVAEAMRLEEKYNLPKGVFLALVQQESGFNPNAVSKAGAYGLAQLMPGTASGLNVDPRDPMQNLDGGARYLAEQIATFGDLSKGLAAYNAGPGAVRKAGNAIPNFPETQKYVAAVMRNAGYPMAPPKLADGGLIELARKYADGGSVAGAAQVYDPAVIAAIAASITEPQGYAEGGRAASKKNTPDPKKWSPAPVPKRNDQDLAASSYLTKTGNGPFWEGLGKASPELALGMGSGEMGQGEVGGDESSAEGGNDALGFKIRGNVGKLGSSPYVNIGGGITLPLGDVMLMLDASYGKAIGYSAKPDISVTGGVRIPFADGGTTTGVSSDDATPRTFADLVRRYAVGDAMQMGAPLDDPSLGAGVSQSIGDYFRPIIQGNFEVPGTVKKYAIDVATGPKPFTRLGKDIGTFGSAVWEGVKNDPVGTALDILPVVGEVRSGMDAHEFRNKAEAAERAGDEKQAAMFRQLSAVGMAGAIPLVGMASRAANRGVKLGVEGAEAAARVGSEGAARKGMEGAVREGVEVVTEHPSMIDTRYPTGKARIDEIEGERLMADFASMQATPKLYEDNVNLVRGYVNMPESSGRGLTDKVAENFINHAKDNLLYLHDQVPDNIRQRSQLWYDGARKISEDWANEYGIADSAAAGAIAALSPQKDWYQNVSLAKRVVDALKGNGENFYNGFSFSPEMQTTYESIASLNKPAYTPIFDQIKGRSLGDINKLDFPDSEKAILKSMWIRLYDEGHNSKAYPIITPEGGFGDAVKTAKGVDARIGWGSMNEISKAIRAIESNGDPKLLNKIMGGKHKVRNFYNNILAPNSTRGDVTIDTHAVAASLMRPLSQKSVEVAHNFNTSTLGGLPGASGSAASGIQGTYPLYAEAYRRAAGERGILPRQMQSITWEAIRGLFPDTFKTPKNMEAVDALWAKYRAGEVSLDETREAVSRFAGGVNPPTWYRPSGAADESFGGAGNAPVVSGSGLPRKASGGIVGRGRGQYPQEPSQGHVQGYADGGSADNSLAALHEKYYGGPTTRQRPPTYEEMGNNPVGWSSVYPPQYMSNQDPNVSPVASRTLMSDAQRLGLLGRRGPVTGADLPALEERGQGLMDNAMTVAGAVNPVGIRAFHSSPHKFDQFDMSKIGTGGGEQVYGRGLYASDSPAVSGRGGNYDKQFTARAMGKVRLNQDEGRILTMLGEGQSELNILRDLAKNGATFDEANSLLNRVQSAKSNIYEVNLNTSLERLLDRNKSLREQPQGVQKALRSGDIAKIQTFTPQDPGRLLAPNRAEMMNLYKDAGIDGIRYIDPSSRTLGNPSIEKLSPDSFGNVYWQVNSGTAGGAKWFDLEKNAQKHYDSLPLPRYNYVMFDDKLIDLLRRYGLLGMVGGGAAAAGNKNKQAPAEEQTDYAQGGSVDSAPVYDPAVIAAIAASITEDDHA